MSIKFHELRLNQSFEPTRVGKPPLSAQLQCMS